MEHCLDLIVEGILRPGDNTSNFELPCIHVTEHGMQALAGTITPYDPDGYLKTVADRIPSLDPIIARYVGESAETLRRNCLLSSTVTLGCAAEQAFLLLVDAFRDALNPAEQSAFDKAMEKKQFVKQQYQEFMKCYERTLKSRLRSAFDSDWNTGLETALSFVFNYFRTNRNDAGHPSDAKFTREVSSANLVIFPTYLRTVYDLIDWLGKNKPL